MLDNSLSSSSPMYVAISNLTGIILRRAAGHVWIHLGDVLRSYALRRNRRCHRSDCTRDSRTRTSSPSCNPSLSLTALLTGPANHPVDGCMGIRSRLRRHRLSLRLPSRQEQSRRLPNRSRDGSHHHVAEPQTHAAQIREGEFIILCLGLALTTSGDRYTYLAYCSPRSATSDSSTSRRVRRSRVLMRKVSRR